MTPGLRTSNPGGTWTRTRLSVYRLPEPRGLLPEYGKAELSKPIRRVFACLRTSPSDGAGIGDSAATL